MSSLVGREGDIRRLHARLTAASGGSATLVGDLGVGKTRLAAEVTAILQREGRVVETAVATAAARQIPMGALAHLLPLRTVDALDDRGRLHQALDLFVSRASDGGYTLVIDDAHLLDAASATLVHHLARGQVVRLLVVLRAGEDAPDAMTSLAKDGHATRFEVGPLPRALTAVLARDVLGGQLAAPALASLWSRTRGNPLFLLELLRVAVDHEAAYELEGVWHLTGDHVPSAILSELVTARLRELGELEKDGVELLALSEPLELSILVDLVGEPTVEGLERRGLVTSSVQGRRASLRLGHPIYSDALRARMPVVRSRALIRRLVLAADRTGSRRAEDLIRTAVWRLASGSPVDEAGATTAGRQALSAFDPRLAERLAHAALQAGGGFDASLLLAEALGHQGRLEEAERLFQDATDLASSEGARARVAIAHAESAFFRAGDPGRAIAIAEQAAAGLVDEDWRDEIEALLAFFASFAGDLRKAASAAQRALERSDASPRAVVSTLVIASVSLLLLGRLDEVAEPLRVAQAREPEARQQLPLARFQLLATEGMALAYGESLEEALAFLTGAYDNAIEERALQGIGLLGSALVHVSALRGDTDLALRVGGEALVALERADPVAMRPLTVAHCAYAAALAGDVARARRWLDGLDGSDEARDIRAAFAADLARTRLAALTGDLRRAEQVAAAQAESLARSHPVWAAVIAHEAVRVGRPQAVGGVLEELATVVDGGLVVVLAEHASALARTAGGKLEKVSQTFASLGAPLHASEAMAQAAKAHRQARDARGEARAVFTARRLASLVGGARVPGLAENVWPLTAREEEVARLAARGWANRQIAHHLVVSVRTVENHLSAVYAKLRIGGRDELVDMMGGAPLD